MFRTAYLGLTLAFALLLTGCSQMPDKGVPQKLATARHASLHEVRYEVHFDLPATNELPVEGQETVRFLLDRRTPVILDFRVDPSHLHTVRINGDKIDVSIVNEHIVIQKQYVKEGPNTVEISFTAGDQSLNRRDEFLYTLLVPDRARTLFPCFDQPDIKAQYTLSLTVPEALSSHTPSKIWLPEAFISVIAYVVPFGRIS